MSHHSDDYYDLVAQRRFLDEVENGIRMVNREIIHEKIPDVTQDRFLKFAVMVSRLRADYMAAAFELVEASSQIPDDEVMKVLRVKREKYDEGVHAFEALRRAIERGYVDVQKG
jgi:hypothetical protein